MQFVCTICTRIVKQEAAVIIAGEGQVCNGCLEEYKKGDYSNKNYAKENFD